MTKEQFLDKWAFKYNVNYTTNPYFIDDLEAVIATEIAKVQEAQPQPIELKGNCSTFDGSRLVDQVQPALNPIEQAYERGEKIRMKEWPSNLWIMKHTKTEAIDELKNTYDVTNWAMKPHPEKWELYTEPTEQPVMTEKEKIDHILTNKLTWKPMGNKRFYANWFSAESDEGYRQVHFVDYNNPHSGYFETRIFTIDLTEWQPVETKKPSSQVKLDNPFDKDRFEAMFRAVVASGEYKGKEFDKTAESLKQLDAYYASKEGGANG